LRICSAIAFVSSAATSLARQTWFSPLNKIINVHGCFWHLHTCRHGKRSPVTNAAYWTKKRFGNLERDRRNLRKLRRQGWKVLTIWECQTRDIQRLTARLRSFLAR